MAIQSATEFFEKMKADDNFRGQILNFESNEERLEFIKENGFRFTQEELEETAKNYESENQDDVLGQDNSGCCDFCAGDLINRCYCDTCNSYLQK